MKLSTKKRGGLKMTAKERREIEHEFYLILRRARELTPGLDLNTTVGLLYLAKQLTAELDK